MSVCGTVGRAVRNRFLTLDRLLVSLDVEVDEQQEVAGQQHTSEHGSDLGSGAGAKMGQVREVVGGIVVVGYE